MEAFLGPIRDLDVRYRSTGNDPNVVPGRMARHRHLREGRRRVLLVLVGAADPERDLRPRHARRHAHRLLSADLYRCGDRWPGPKPIAAGINAHDAGSRHALARAEERVAPCPRIAAAFAGNPCRRAAVPRRARSRSPAAGHDGRGPPDGGAGSNPSAGNADSAARSCAAPEASRSNRGGSWSRARRACSAARCWIGCAPTANPCG